MKVENEKLKTAGGEEEFIVWKGEVSGIIGEWLEE